MILIPKGAKNAEAQDPPPSPPESRFSPQHAPIKWSIFSIFLADNRVILIPLPPTIDFFLKLAYKVDHFFDFFCQASSVILIPKGATNAQPSSPP